MRCARCLSTIDDESRFCPFCGHGVASKPAPADYTYEAFISYRHLPRDRRAAIRIQRSLEGMRIPREARGEGGPARLGKLFRDEDELPTSDSLTDQIREALRHSRYLIVVASPEMRESMWVQREVELFSSLHGRDRVIVALTAGEPEESFPELLLSRLEVDQVGKTTRVACEPIAADLREGTGKRFGVEVLRIAARLIGCGFDDLRQRQRTRRMRLVTGVASVVAAVSLAFGSFALYQRAQIATNFRQAQIRESEALAVESGELLAQGDRIQAIEVALAALPGSSSSNDRPLVPAAQLALESALQPYPSQAVWQPAFSVANTTRYTFETSDGGLFATRLVDGRFYVGSLADGREVCVFDPIEQLCMFDDDKSLYDVDAFFVGESLLVQKHGALGLFDPADGTAVWTIPIDDLCSYDAVEVSPDDAQIAIAKASHEYNWSSTETDEGNSIQCIVLDSKSGELVREASLPLTNDISFSSRVKMAFSPDGNTLALGTNNHVFLLDLTSGRTKEGEISTEYLSALSFVGKQVITVGGSSLTAALSITEPVMVELLDEDLRQVWSHAETQRITFDAHGSWEDNGDATVIGVRSYDGFEGEQALLAIGCDVIMLNLESGMETYRLQRDAPILAAWIGGQKDNVYLVDADGDIVFRHPLSDGKVTGTSWDMNVGGLYEARLGATNDIHYVAFWDFSSQRWHVMSYGARSKGSRVSQALDGVDEVLSWSWSDEVIACVTTTDLVALSSEDFQELWRMPKTSLDPDDGGIRLLCGVDAVCVYGKSFSKMRTIFLLSPDDGSLLDSIELDEEKWNYAPDNLGEATMGDDDVLVALGIGLVQVIDRASHEVLFSLESDLGSNEVFRWAEIVGNDLLLFEVGDAGGHYRVIDLSSGEDRTCDLTTCVTSTSSDIPPFASFTRDGDRFVTACSDGTIRCFETSGWSLLWSRDDVAPSTQFLKYAADGGRLLVQDGSGVLMLLDATDGSVLAASSSKLPSLQWCRFSVDDPNLIHALWRYSGELFDVGVSIISLDEDCFGPLSTIYLGVFCSGDGQSVLGYDDVFKQALLYPRYTLDELIALGREEIAGRELTEAERHIYRIS